MQNQIIHNTQVDKVDMRSVFFKRRSPKDRGRGWEGRIKGKVNFFNIPTFSLVYVVVAMNASSLKKQALQAFVGCGSAGQSYAALSVVLHYLSSKHLQNIWGKI